MPATLVVHRAPQMVARLARLTVHVDGVERASLKADETATIPLEPGAHTLRIALDGGAAPEHGVDVGDREDAFVLHASVVLERGGNEVRLASSTGVPWPPVATPPAASSIATPAPAELASTPDTARPEERSTHPIEAAAAVPHASLQAAATAATPDSMPTAPRVPGPAASAPFAAPAAGVQPHRGGLILGLGLFTMFGLPLVAGMLLGIYVSVSLSLLIGGATAAMGAHDLRRMARGTMNARGRVLTIIGVVVAALSVLSSAAALVFGARLL